MHLDKHGNVVLAASDDMFAVSLTTPLPLPENCLYLDQDGAALCPKCAGEQVVEDRDDPEANPMNAVAYGYPISPEDPEVTCSDCSRIMARKGPAKKKLTQAEITHHLDHGCDGPLDSFVIISRAIEVAQTFDVSREDVSNALYEVLLSFNWIREASEIRFSTGS